MRLVALFSLVTATAAFAEPVLITPPVGDTPELVEAGLLMQAEAGRWLVTNRQSELHVKQLLRALERHRLQVKQLEELAIATRAQTLLGASGIVTGRLTNTSLRVTAMENASEAGTESAHGLIKNLPADLSAKIEEGASALIEASGVKVAKPIAVSLGSKNAAAVASYGTCYAILIRQPISIDSPTVLSHADVDRAINACRASVSADAKFEAAWAALGLALAISGQDADAVAALVKVNAKDKYLPLYWLARYWLVTRYQSPDAGAAVLRAALAQHPGFFLARGYLGEHLVVTKQLDEALRVWQAYSVALPKNAFLRGRVSSTLAKLGRHDEAIAYARAGIEIDRADPDAVLELGSRLLDAGKRDEAIAVLQGAVSGKSRGELLLRLGWAYFGKNDLDKAESYFTRAEAAASDPAEWRTRARARADLARVSEKRGDTVGMTKAIDRALEEGAGAYLKAQQDKRLVELVVAAEKTPRKPSNGPRLLKPKEVSPFTIDPAGEIDPKVRQFPTPPAQFELLRF